MEQDIVNKQTVLKTILLVTCYLYVDRLVKLHQLLTPTSFQWSSSLFLNMLTEVDVTTLLGNLFHTSITLWLKKFWRTCRVDRDFESTDTSLGGSVILCAIGKVIGRSFDPLCITIISRALRPGSILLQKILSLLDGDGMGGTHALGMTPKGWPSIAMWWGKCHISNTPLR